jgi:hypothetical protein
MSFDIAREKEKKLKFFDIFGLMDKKNGKYFCNALLP